MILVQAINNRVIRQPLREVDIVILYEILLCCEIVIQFPSGIEEFLGLSNGIESISRCFCLESKLYALKILEILTTISSHSTEAAYAAFKGLKVDVDIIDSLLFKCVLNAYFSSHPKPERKCPSRI